MPFVPQEGPTQPSTYVAETATISGAATTTLLSLFNPANSGVIVRVRRIMLLNATPAGTRTDMLFEIRRMTAHSAGTLLTATRFYTADPVSACGPRSLATVTDAALHHSEILQSTEVRLVMDILGSTGGENEPFICQPGQGVHLKQITSDGSSFRVNIVWTEE
jgi:hypothetical protein